MTGLIKKIFGGGKKTQDDLVEELLLGLLERAGIQLSYEISFSKGNEVIEINLFGSDEDILVEKKARLLDEIEFFISKAFKNSFPDQNTRIQIDCNQYRESLEKKLQDEAGVVRKKVLERKKPVFMKPLSAKDRRIVHQWFSEDGRFETCAIGEGYYKKIKISLANNNRNADKGHADNGNSEHGNSDNGNDRG